MSHRYWAIMEQNYLSASFCWPLLKRGHDRTNCCPLFYWPLCIGHSSSGLFCLASSLGFNSLHIKASFNHSGFGKRQVWPRKRGHNGTKLPASFCCSLCIVLSFTGLSVLYSLLLASLYCTLFYWPLCIVLSSSGLFYLASTLGSYRVIKRGQ